MFCFCPHHTPCLAHSRGGFGPPPPPGAAKANTATTTNWLGSSVQVQVAEHCHALIVELLVLRRGLSRWSGRNGRRRGSAQEYKSKSPNITMH